jgi:AraC-like DNA-binding protein
MEPRTDLRKNSSANGEWESATRGPIPALRGLVLSYQDYSEKAVSPIRRLEVPFSGIPVVISFGQIYTIIDAEGNSEVHSTFAAGLSDAWVVVDSERETRGVQINLTPIGARLFLGLPMSEITNRVVDLRAVLGPVARNLGERLEAATGWGQRFAILDDFIVRRLANAGQPSVPVIWAWNKVQTSGGNINVRALVDELGYSHRRLIQEFRDQIGLPPKVMARIVRFERAVKMISSGAGSLPDVAFECGYYDQAHFNREFREFSGRTPSEFAAGMIAPGMGVSVDQLEA